MVFWLFFDGAHDIFWNFPVSIWAHRKFHTINYYFQLIRWHIFLPFWDRSNTTLKNEGLKLIEKCIHSLLMSNTKNHVIRAWSGVDKRFDLFGQFWMNMTLLTFKTDFLHSTDFVIDDAITDNNSSGSILSHFCQPEHNSPGTCGSRELEYL